MDPYHPRNTLFSFGGLRKFLSLFSILLPLTAIAAETNGLRHVHFREPREGHYLLTGHTNQAEPQAPRQPWTQARREGSSKTVEIGSRLVLQVDDPARLKTLLANRGLTISRTVNPNLLILQASDSTAAI